MHGLTQASPQCTRKANIQLPPATLNRASQQSYRIIFKNPAKVGVTPEIARVLSYIFVLLELRLNNMSPWNHSVTLPVMSEQLKHEQTTAPVPLRCIEFGHPGGISRLILSRGSRKVLDLSQPLKRCSAQPVFFSSYSPNTAWILCIRWRVSKHSTEHTFSFVLHPVMSTLGKQKSRCVVPLSCSEPWHTGGSRLAAPCTATTRREHMRNHSPNSWVKNRQRNTICGNW